MLIYSFFKLLSLVVSWGLDFEFGLGLTLGLIRARVTVWVKFGVRARIAFFLFVRWRANNFCFFQTVGFYRLLVGNKPRTKVLQLLITRARPTYWSADIRAKSIYRISYLPPIKYRLGAITLNSLFFRASTSTLAFYLQSMTCV